MFEGRANVACAQLRITPRQTILTRKRLTIWMMRMHGCRAFVGGKGAATCSTRMSTVMDTTMMRYITRTMRTTMMD